MLDTTTLSSSSSFANFRLLMNHMIRRGDTGAACPRNSHGVAHKRSLPQSIAPIPDLRSNLLSVSAPGFTGTHTLSNKVNLMNSLLGGRLYPYESRYRCYRIAVAFGASRRVPRDLPIIAWSYVGVLGVHPYSFEMHSRLSSLHNRVIDVDFDHAVVLDIVCTFNMSWYLMRI